MVFAPLFSEIGSVPKGFEFLLGLVFFLIALSIPVMIGAGLVQTCFTFLSLRKTQPDGWRRKIILGRQIFYMIGLFLALAGILYFYVRSMF